MRFGQQAQGPGARRPPLLWGGREARTGATMGGRGMATRDRRTVRLGTDAGSVGRARPAGAHRAPLLWEAARREPARL